MTKLLNNKVFFTKSLLVITIILIVISQFYGAPHVRAQEYAQEPAPYAVYEGCINAQVVVPEVPGSPVLPLHACVQVSFIEGGQPKITVVSLASPITSIAILKRVIGDTVNRALSEAIIINRRVSAISGEFLYVRGTEPVACKQLYRAYTGNLDVIYIYASRGLIPVIIHANVTEATFKANLELTLTHLSDETACGSSVLSDGKVAILKGGTLAVLVGALASILWRIKTKPVVVIYRYAFP